MMDYRETRQLLRDLGMTRENASVALSRAADQRRDIPSHKESPMYVLEINRYGQRVPEFRVEEAGFTVTVVAARS